MAGEHEHTPAPADGVGTDRPAETEPASAHTPALDSEGSAEGASEAVEQDLEELLSKARQRDEYRALAQRIQADFENYRKRAAKELSTAEGRGVAKLARELLPALDNLGLALAASEQRDPDAAEHHLAEGIKLVHAELLAALARVGIEPFSPQGERFDPNMHEAMAQHEVEGAESGTVVEVYQQGFRLDGQVLRPARVVVAA